MPIEASTRLLIKLEILAYFRPAYLLTLVSIPYAFKYGSSQQPGLHAADSSGLRYYAPGNSHVNYHV